MKNKKIICLSMNVLFVVMLSFVALASNAQRVNNSNASRTKTTNNSSTNSASSDVDLDLVKLNQTMLYSQLVNIAENYESYLGKKIRLAGNMNVVNGGGANNYFIVECSDVTACCNQGLEFILKNGSTKIEDYPDTGDRVLVSGTLEKYYEGSNPYIHLVNSECKVLKEAETNKDTKK